VFADDTVIIQHKRCCSSDLKNVPHWTGVTKTTLEPVIPLSHYGKLISVHESYWWKSAVIEFYV
jgi:hypothetical protein